MVMGLWTLRVVIPHTKNEQVGTMAYRLFFHEFYSPPWVQFRLKTCPLQTSCLVTGAAQLQSCHDSTGCGGNLITGVSTARDCCLGSGLSFQIAAGICQRCIGKELQCSEVSMRDERRTYLSSVLSFMIRMVS